MVVDGRVEGADGGGGRDIGWAEERFQPMHGWPLATPLFRTALRVGGPYLRRQAVRPA